MTQVFRAALLTALTGLSLYSQNVVGDWHGNLKVGGAELRLNLHVIKGGDGVLKATLDSVDQATIGIPVSSVSLQGTLLKLTIAAIQGTYEGNVNADSTLIGGTWTQGQPFPLEFRRGSTPQVEHKPAKPSDIDGSWSGTLEVGGAKLRIIFHIVNTGDGLTATTDSPDQGATGLPVNTVTKNGSSLKLEMKSAAATFEGQIASDLSSITGKFTQNGLSLPLTLSR